MRRPAGSLLAAVLGICLVSETRAQTRRIDDWSGVVLNCGPGAIVAWAERVCNLLIGEMRKRADAAKVAFVAMPAFADDVTLDRRASEEGLDFFRVLHVRFDVSPPTGPLKSRDLKLVLRSLTAGSLFAMRSDGPYKILSHTPMMIINEAEAARRAPWVAETLAENFFVPMLKARP